MRIRTTQLLKLEDVPNDQKPWVAKLIQPINDFFNQAIAILNDGGVFPDNYVGLDHVFTFTYTSDAVNFPIKCRWDLNQKPNALQVVSALENGTPIIALVAWAYTDDGSIALTSVVKVTSSPSVALLTAGAKYQIRVRATP